MEAPQERILIDARGSFCPGPLMELVRGIRQARVGEVVEVWSSDQGSRRDIPFWAKKAGHELLGVFDEPGYSRFVVRKVR
jgi:TusA-related sulfurtransferase